MRRSSAAKRARIELSVPYTCHWGHVPNPRPDDRSQRTVVWICEYPYRTMRMEGPSEECAGCPVWEARCKAKRAEAVTERTAELVH